MSRQAIDFYLKKVYSEVTSVFVSKSLDNGTSEL